MSTATLTRYRGDTCALALALTNPDDGLPFDPTNQVLIFSVKKNATDPDTDALIQKISTVGGFTIDDAPAGLITVELVPQDWALLRARNEYAFDVQAQDGVSGAVRTVASGTLEATPDVTKGLTLSITTYTTNPPLNTGGGTVLSVGLSMPGIFAVAGSPITVSGTIAVTLATQAANLVLAGPTTGAAATPTFRALVAADVPDLSGSYQPLDADLTAIAALTTTSYGRSFLELANAAAARTLIGAVIGTDVQAYDADLAAIAALSTASYGRSVLTLANAGDARTYFGLVIGTDVQAYDANNLTPIAGLTSTSYGRGLLELADDAAVQDYINIEIGTNVEAWSASLDALAAVSTTGRIYYYSATNTWTAVTIGASLTFTAGTLNAALTLVAAATGFTIAGGTASKTLTVSNTLTLAGTDATTMTFPTTSATLARTDAANTFTGAQAFLSTITSGAASGTTGALLLKGTTSGTFTMSVNDAAGTWTAKWPATAGTSGYALTTDGAGILSWTLIGGTGVALGDSPTWTGIHTWTPTARTSGVAAYFTVNAPADTGRTATTESIGVNFVGATRTWADGTTAAQREYLFQAPTYNKTTTAATFSKAATLAVTAAPTAGSGVTITEAYALWVQAGLTQLDGALIVTGQAGLNVNPVLTSSGAVVKVGFLQPADTGVTAAAEMNFFKITGGTVTHANGTVTTERLVRIAPSTIAFTSAGTVTSAYTLAVDGPPNVGAGATLTTKWAFGVLTGNTRLGGQLIFLDTGEAAVTTSPGISNTTGLLTLSSVGGLNLRPSLTSGGICSIAGTAQDLVVSDSTTTTSWQGAAITGKGIYNQRAAATSTIAGLSVGTGNNANFEGQVCNGAYGALTATESGRGANLLCRTYGGSTWVNNGIVGIQTTQTQSESARGSKIVFYTTADSTTTQRNVGNINQDGSLLMILPTAGIGYGTGAGGAVTQGTNRTTGVTLNTVVGAITLFSAAGSTTPQTFTVTNSAVAIGDFVACVQKSGTDLNVILVTNIAAGSFKITFYTTGGTTTEQPVFKFIVLKGAEA